MKKGEYISLFEYSFWVEGEKYTGKSNPVTILTEDHAANEFMEITNNNLMEECRQDFPDLEDFKANLINIIKVG